MESWLQNSEYRNSLENFHPWSGHFDENQHMITSVRLCIKHMMLFDGFFFFLHFKAVESQQKIY